MTVGVGHSHIASRSQHVTALLSISQLLTSFLPSPLRDVTSASAGRGSEVSPMPEHSLHFIFRALTKDESLHQPLQNEASLAKAESNINQFIKINI